MHDMDTTQEILEMLLAGLNGIEEPRKLIVTHAVGELSITVEATNFSGEIWEEPPDQDG